MLENLPASVIKRRCLRAPRFFAEAEFKILRPLLRVESYPMRAFILLAVWCVSNRERNDNAYFESPLFPEQWPHQGAYAINVGKNRVFRGNAAPPAYHQAYTSSSVQHNCCKEHVLRLSDARTRLSTGCVQTAAPSAPLRQFCGIKCKAGEESVDGEEGQVSIWFFLVRCEFRSEISKKKKTGMLPTDLAVPFHHNPAHDSEINHQMWRERLERKQPGPGLPMVTGNSGCSCRILQATKEMASWR